MNAEASRPPVVSVVGTSGAGKTTLLERLIRELTRRGLRVGIIKHHPGDFEMDRPGKDSWRLKRAGAAVAVISGPDKVGLVMDRNRDARVEELIPLFAGMDLVITEGYKREPYPKIEVVRQGTGPPLCLGDGRLMALVGDAEGQGGRPVFSVDDVEALAAFLISRFHLAPAVSESAGGTASVPGAP